MCCFNNVPNGTGCVFLNATGSLHLVDVHPAQRDVGQRLCTSRHTQTNSITQKAAGGLSSCKGSEIRNLYKTFKEKNQICLSYVSFNVMMFYF